MNELDDKPSWEDLYALWSECCARYETTPRLPSTSIITFNKPVDLAASYSWAKIDAPLEKIAPRVRTIKGYAFLDSHSRTPSVRTAELLDSNAADNELFACSCLAAGLFQLLQDMPTHWPWSHSRKLITDMCRTCFSILDFPNLYWFWGERSKYIFPEKFYSPLLLETTSDPTERQLIEFSYLNSRYYLEAWQIAKYRIKPEVKQAMHEQTLARLNQVFGTAGSDKSELSMRLEFPPDDDTTPIASFSLHVHDSASRKTLYEGERRKRTSSTAERNPLARKICLEHYGCQCAVCGLDFGKRFGNEFSHIIDVHHVNPISQQNGLHIVDPIRDLIPLCPNCHRMIHSKPGETYTVEELRAIVKQSGKTQDADCAKQRRSTSP